VSLEQVIVLAIFLLVALFNFVRQVLAQRRQRGEVPEEEPAEEAPPPPRAPTPPPRVIVVPPQPVAAPAPPRRPRAEPLREGPAPRPVPRPRPRRPRRRLFASRGEARRGIVLLTVLGPCRGVEPPAEPTGDIHTATLPR
jgi:hypothetical protein